VGKAGLTTSHEGPGAITSSDIRAQLERILSSPDFVVPDRAHRFLEYVVTEAVSGRADRIKAYSIATEVFGRGPRFDPQFDPVVRIEAGRVRRALERYYLTAGSSDPIVITIPKGSYAPAFFQRTEERRPDKPAPSMEPSNLKRWQRTPSIALWTFAAIVLVFAAWEALHWLVFRVTYA
jgi:hypothetical protein